MGKGDRNDSYWQEIIKGKGARKAKAGMGFFLGHAVSQTNL